MFGPDQISDGGPWYAETHITNNLIVEPWNAFSSLVIAAPAVYFLWKIRKQPLQYGFLLWCIPILFLNGIGSTLFHGLRSSRVFLVMDYMPALLLTLSITAYLWIKILPKWWMGILVMVGVFLARFGIFAVFSGQFAINMSYAIGGIAFLLPVVLILKRTGGDHIVQILLAIVCFILAIYFRGADKDFTHIVPFGTHFLWHIFTGIGAFLLADYLYFIRTRELASQKTYTVARSS